MNMCPKIRDNCLLNILRGMTVFAEVAKRQGFAPAARSLGLSTSAVSRHVMELEDWLGAQLFHRTTRQLSLTEDGARYLGRCQQVIADIEGIKQMGADTQAEPQGKLRITAPTFIAKSWLQTLLPGYLGNHTKVDVELTAVDRFVDLVAEGFDLALRAGELADSTLVARRLADINLALVASPAYLTKHGIPETVDELKTHNCLVDTIAGYANRWPMLDGIKSKAITVRGNIRVNSGEIVRSLAIAGVGIALLPRFFVLEDVQQGRLRSFLESNIEFNAGLFAVYPQRKYVSTNVRSFIDFMADHLEQLKIQV